MRLLLIISSLLISVVCLGGVAPVSRNYCDDISKKLNIKEGDIMILSPELRNAWKSQIPALANIQAEGIIHTKAGLILYENGSGRLFKFDSTGAVEQLDKTRYSGERFGAQVFYYRDTIFSIGGYGFWHVNGAVRFFDEKTGEWGIVKTELEVPFANGVNAYSCFSRKTNKVYVIFSDYPNEYLSIRHHQSLEQHLMVQVFDVPTKKWLAKPLSLNPLIAHEIGDIKLFHTSKNGLLIQSKLLLGTFEIDFDRNAVFEVPDHFATQLIQLNEKTPVKLTYVSDSGIFFYNPINDSLVNLKTQNIITQKIGSLFLSPSHAVTISQEQLLIALVVSNVLTLALFLYFLLKYYRKKTLPFDITQAVSADEANAENKKLIHFFDLLNEVETNIVKTLALNNKEGKNTSIDEINKIIGIDKRPYKIRNNMRADVLKMINKKFKVFADTQDELVDRQRSAFDKRYFEYTLNPRYSSKLMIKTS